MRPPTRKTSSRRWFIVTQVLIIRWEKITMLRLLSASLATAIILAGCNQDTATPVTNSGRTAEPPEATLKDFGDYVVHFSAMSTDLLQP